MWLTAVPCIRSTRLHGCTSSTQYLVAKQIQNTKRHNLHSTAAILCKSNNCYWNICVRIKLCFPCYRADRMFNQELLYRQKWKNCSCQQKIVVALCKVSHITLTQLRPFIHWLHNKFHIKIYFSVHFNSNKCNHIVSEQPSLRHTWNV